MAETGLNNCQFIGRLADDGELRNTSGGSAVLKFRIACTEQYKDQGGAWKDKTEWVPVVLFGRRASGLAQYLTKGSRVYVQGGMRTSSYEAKDGSGKRYRTEIVASNVILLGSKGGERSTGSSASSGSGYSDDDYGGAGDDSEIPF